MTTMCVEGKLRATMTVPCSCLVCILACVGEDADNGTCRAVIPAIPEFQSPAHVLLAPGERPEVQPPGSGPWAVLLLPGASMTQTQNDV